MSYLSDIVSMLRVDDETGERLPVVEARKKPFSDRQVTTVHYLMSMAIDEPDESDGQDLGHKAAVTLSLRLAKAYMDEHAKVARAKRALDFGEKAFDGL